MTSAAVCSVSGTVETDGGLLGFVTGALLGPGDAWTPPGGRVSGAEAAGGVGVIGLTIWPPKWPETA